MRLRRRSALVPAPFVVGVARSGTTLLRLMLDSHPALAIPAETHFIPAAAHVWKHASDRPAAFLDLVCGHERWPDFGLGADELRSAIHAARPHTLADALDVFYALCAADAGKARWGDKTPPYVDWMKALARWYPRAHFVHIVRDGRDVALSVIDLPFGPSSLEEAAFQWTQRIARARRQARRLHRYVEVRFEDLVEDPAPVLRSVCQAIGLDWDPAMLRYHERAADRLAPESRPVWLPESGTMLDANPRERLHANVLREPDRGRIGLWRTLMSRAQKEAFVAVAGDTLQALGYPLT